MIKCWSLLFSLAGLVNFVLQLFLAGWSWSSRQQADAGRCRSVALVATSPVRPLRANA